VENNKGRFQIKIFFGDNNIRRYSFDQSPTWAGFFETFKQLFRAEYNPQRFYQFSYFDPENDRIVIDSEAEWVEMLHLFHETPLLKIHVKEEMVNRKLLEERKEQEEKIRKEAEEKARKEAEEKTRKIAEEKARKEGEEKARKIAEEKTRKEAEEKARKIAEEKAKKESEEKARKIAEEKAKKTR